MKGSHRRASRILFWMLSVLVVLSMALGLAISVMPQPRPPTFTPTPAPFLFAVCGDFAATGGEAGNTSAYDHLMNQVGEDGNFFLIHTGNLLSDGSESSFQEFSERMARFPLPFYPAPGNRDHYQGTLDNFTRYSGAPDVHYSFDYGTVHFTLANSNLGDMTSQELAWLRRDLATSQQPVKMVFLHYPPFAPAASADIMRSGNEEFMALMEDEGVSYVFAGHDPSYHAEDRRGVHYVISGGPGASPDPQSEGHSLSRYVRVAVRGTEVTVEPIPLRE
jgi:hypothetical protein